ncbi:MAG: restriction endonuclease subunit S [Endomicrobium sp.]|nr:restriction endonuclease subunit S [Endomicrobium sp.]
MDFIQKQSSRKFLFHYFMANWDNLFLDRQGKFTWLSATKLRGISILVPSLSEQQKIVAEIETYGAN